jgi:adenylosuccinate synthase
MAATIIVDAFWGDAGKGKFCAYLADVPHRRRDRS